MQIDPSQGITLYAFFEALAQQTAPLPADLKQKISAVGKIFPTDIDRAVDQLADLAQHPHLQPIYFATRLQIQPDYQPVELNPSLQIPEVIDLPPEILDNTLSTLQSPDRPIAPVANPNSSQWWHHFFSKQSSK